MRCWLVVTGLAIAWLGATATGAAHDIGAARAKLDERPGARYVLEVEAPLGFQQLFQAPELPERCALGEAQGGPGPDATVLRYEFDCGDRPLTASDVLRLPWQRQGALITARWADGATASRFFTREGGVIEVPLAALQAGSGSLLDAARRYLVLGIEHILLGIDHLLFVLGLLLLVRGPWMLVQTITAFTLAHSITLALATLGFVAVPPRPVEAAIALSIVFLAAEVIHRRHGRIGLAARQPWVVAFAFGLLHGFGFAGALAELGLPVGEIPVTLLFFNVGVELGQLAFVAVVVVLGLAVRRLVTLGPTWTEVFPAYAIGTAAAYWLIERIGAIVPA